MSEQIPDYLKEDEALELLETMRDMIQGALELETYKRPEARRALGRILRLYAERLEGEEADDGGRA